MLSAIFVLPSPFFPIKIEIPLFKVRSSEE
jgi:hypothetical protein